MHQSPNYKCPHVTAGRPAPILYEYTSSDGAGWWANGYFPNQGGLVAWDSPLTTPGTQRGCLLDGGGHLR